MNEVAQEETRWALRQPNGVSYAVSPPPCMCWGKISLQSVGDAKDCREAQPRPLCSGGETVKCSLGLFVLVRTEPAQTLKML